MKKMYITPAVEIHKTQVENMMALSVVNPEGGPGSNNAQSQDSSDPSYNGGDALVKEWNIWDE